MEKWHRQLHDRSNRFLNYHAQFFRNPQNLDAKAQKSDFRRDMTPGAYNITMTRGVRFPAAGAIVLQLIGGSGPFDLTGYTAQAQVRVEPGGDVILDLEPIVTTPLTGEVTLATFTDEETQLYEAGVYSWDFLLTSVTNEVTGRYLAGQFYIVDKITDS